MNRTLRTLLLSYSFDDLAKSYFVINLWLPNVASPIKSQYLYVVLEEISEELPKENKINNYGDFKNFCEELLKLLPSFPSIEDYVPEADWGEIKYYFKKRLFKMFYGGDLSNPYDYYYSFEIIHRNFEDYYLDLINRNPFVEFKFCLELQDDILNTLKQEQNPEAKICPGDLSCPSAQFWEDSVKYINEFEPIEVHGRDLVELYTLKKSEQLEKISINEFANKAFDGKNCMYFFVNNGDKYYPVLPRRYFSVMLDTWGRILIDCYDKIIELEKTANKKLEVGLSIELYNYLSDRIDEKEIFELAVPLDKDMKSNGLSYTAIKAKNKLFLVYITPPLISKELIEGHLKVIAPKIDEDRKNLLNTPTRLGLKARNVGIEFRPKEGGQKLEPVFLIIVPYCTSEAIAFKFPEKLDGIQIVGIDQFVGVIDELEDAEELADFFDYLNDIESFKIPALSSLLDKFGSFRDSCGVLVPGAPEPDFVMLDFNWGSDFRFRTLSKFWKYFPIEMNFRNPRSWTISEDSIKDNRLTLKSKSFFGYIYYNRIGSASFFINAPVHLMEFEQGIIADPLMQSLSDAIELNTELLNELSFIKDGNKIQVMFFPSSAVDSKDELRHVRHLIQKIKLWEMDIVRISSRDYGIRVVYDDQALLVALCDAKNRTIQIQLLIDILQEINRIWRQPNLALILGKLELEKSKPARFKSVQVKKKASFPQANIHSVLPNEKERKITDKMIANIANGLKIEPGKYDGEGAKTKLNNLIEKIVEEVDSQVSKYNFEKSLPILLENVDTLINEYENTKIEINLSLDHEVDYARDEKSEEGHNKFLHYHKSYRYLIEKFVQIQPEGIYGLSETSLRELIALVDRLLDIYSASDYLHYGIYPAKIIINSDYIVLLKYGGGIDKMEKDFGIEQARINLGQIGNKEDIPEIKIPIIDYLEQIESAFKIDFGFSFKDLVNLQQILSLWAEHNESVKESTYYCSTAEEILSVCSKVIKGVDVSGIQNVLDFLTLDPSGLLKIEGDSSLAKDLPIWEHAKRLSRYTIRPIIKIENRYFWGAYSIERSAHIWSDISFNHYLPADINAPTVSAVLEKGHVNLENCLVLKGKEIVERFTKYVEKDFFPHNIDSSIKDIGDYDILAYLPDKNVLLNIESKIIDPAYSLKDLGRIQRKIFGRVKGDKTFEKRYLQKVEEREAYLNKNYELVMSHFGWKAATKPKVVSIFLTKMAYWWTKYPPVKTNINFVEMRLLEDFIRNI